MITKITFIFGIAIITTLAVFLLGTDQSPDLSDTFVVNAVYFADQNLVQISFEDTSGQSTLVIMEIQGMDESFQKYYEKTSFVENVTFELAPKFGWKVHPVTFVVQHPLYEQIGIKTEIHAPNEAKPAVIYSSL